MKANLVIRASAGTGKTFSLATRFIRLMLFQDVAPERIVALTFSRAAAQEIYVKLLERLWDAALSERGAQNERALLLQGLSDGERAAVEAAGVTFTQARFAAALRGVVNAQEVGSIATLDSFILRIVRSFPLEMGFQNAVDVLDDYGAQAALGRACGRLLEGTDAQPALEADYRTATRGTFVRTCVATFGKILGAWREFLVAHPGSAGWTADSMCAALGVDPAPECPDLSSVPQYGKSRDPRDSAVAHIRNFTAADELFPGNTAGKLLRHLFAQPTATEYVCETKSEQKRRFDCGAEGAAALRAGVRYMAAVKIRAQLEVVAAKLRLCALVERDYDATTRRQGLLTFSDFTDCQAVNEDSEKGLRLQNLQFRFDERFEHWALDEFQDTSALQWLCLKRLVREAAEDPSRTVMVVGDLKQSIYAWRGGDDRPFREILEDWDAFRGEHGESVRNDVSYRYAKHTADFINRVFGPDNLGADGCLGGACPSAVARWLDESCWMEHRPDAKGGVPKTGDRVEIVGVEPDPRTPESEPAEASEDEGGGAAMRILAPKVCARVRELWERHERLADGRCSTDTIGILVRSNRDGAYLAEQIRNLPDTDIPVVWEGADGILDTPVVRGVLELLKLAAHPEDSFAWETVDRLFPIRERVFPSLRYPTTVSQEVSRMLSQLGLARTLREIVVRLTAGESGLSARTVGRLEALVRAGVNFEARTDAANGLEDFQAYLKSAAGREVASSPRVVRILTIHRSKGLTLDHVIVPIPESGNRDSIVRPHAGTVLSGPGWALEASSADLAGTVPALAEAWARTADERLMDQLRLYYVALTRARKTTCVFVVRDPHGGRIQFRDVLLRPFAGPDAPAPVERPWGLELFASGEPPAFGCRETSVPGRPAWEHARGSDAVERRSPSTLPGERPAGGSATAADLFAPTCGDAAETGTRRHAAWAEIEWLGPGTASDETARRILASAWREAFVKPTPDATVWRERSYELFDGKRWESGRFDRVVFAGAGATRTATVYDFKTNARRTDETEEAFAERMRATYASAMAAYRTALTRLTGLPAARVACVLLLAATGQAVPVDGTDAGLNGKQRS